MPPLVAPIGAPSLYVDPALAAQLVRATTKGITSVSAPITTTHIDDVVALVWIVKSMREMSCETFLRKQDMEIARR